jgi:hypothetical protein
VLARRETEVTLMGPATSSLEEAQTALDFLAEQMDEIVAPWDEKTRLGTPATMVPA